MSHLTPMAMAKEKHGASAWSQMTAAEQRRAIEARQDDYRRVRSPARSAGRSPARSLGRRSPPPGGASSSSPPRAADRAAGGIMAGSLSDMTSLLSSLQLQSTSAALSDGHAAQLTALQDAVISSMLAVEKEMDKLHAQTEVQLKRFAAERARLQADNDEAVAGREAAEAEAARLRASIAELADRRAAAPRAAAPRSREAAVEKIASESPNTAAALSSALASEAAAREQARSARTELGATEAERARLAELVAQQAPERDTLEETVAALRKENEELRMAFSLRLDEMATAQERLRQQQEQLATLAREGLLEAEAAEAAETEAG